MYDYLVDHAMKNVWCTPDQDYQAIVKPKRLTPANGVFGKVDVIWRTHELPEKTARFHVYQIGQLHPYLMGLFPRQLQWVSISDNCMLQNMVVDIYSSKGVQMPRTQVWYMVTADKNLIFAVKEQLSIPFKLAEEDLFVRVYTNAYFHSLRSDKTTNAIRVFGKKIVKQSDILDIQVQWQQHVAKTTGHAYAFVNGFQLSSIDLFTVALGDYVEFIYDSSIFKVMEFAIADLKSFRSELDAKYKFLLHYPGIGSGTIDYHDDMDVFLIKRDPNNRFRGVYYHRNQVDAVRMVTHKDYSIPVSYLVGMATTQETWPDITELTLRLHIRRSGYHRPLVDENNRVKELYKLSDDDLMGAMLGLDSVVPVWRAEELEKSDYTKIMRSDTWGVNSLTVQNGYGYNAMSKLLCDTPRFVRDESTAKVIDVPYGLQARSVGYEYDANGLLLGWGSHPNGTIYPVRDTRATLVEMISGQADTRLDEVYGEQEVLLDPKANYRMYVCAMNRGIPSNQWRDVTGEGLYHIENNKLTWLTDVRTTYTMVRSDKVMLAYDLSYPVTDGIIRFSLNTRQLRNNIVGNYVMQIPMGELDLFLNGYSLIENIDYRVNFPEIVIFNKEYLKDVLTAPQKITIRFTGFCNKDMSRVIPDEYGFVAYGLLSKNKRFDIRDDKVMRITVAGKYYDRSELLFAEDHAGIIVPNERNGSPYLIRDIVVPLRGTTTENTYTLRARSKVIDKQISDYLTMKVPEPVITTPNAIPGKYALISPFFTKILHDLQNNILVDPRIQQHYSDMDVLEICKKYEPLLGYDPTQANNLPDTRYVIFHPHVLNAVLDIDIYHYKFMARVNKVYLNNRVEMSHFLRLSA
jgi:hypothetical protein